SGVAGCLANEAGVVRHFHLTPVGGGARALMKGQCLRVIEGTGMQPKTLDRPGPGQVERLIHPPASGTQAEQLRADAKEGELALAFLAKVQFKDAFVLAFHLQRVEGNIWMLEDSLQLIVGKQ